MLTLTAYYRKIDGNRSYFMPKPTVPDVSRELDEHFKSQEPKGKERPALQAVQFGVHQRGSLALIKLPFRSDTVDFGIACRSIKQVADACQVTCLFFDSRQGFESFNGDNTLALARLGLQKIPR